MKNTLARFLKTRKSAHCEKYPRKPLDDILEYLRFIKVEPYIPKGARLLDVGTGDGNFLHYLNGHIHTSVGIDPHLKRMSQVGNHHLIPGYFPYDFDEDMTFDVITILAAIEHIPFNVLPCVVRACEAYLKPGGRVILTAPHPRVDKILKILKSLRMVEGFSIHQHYGFDPKCLPDFFNGWRLLKKERWELGCNYLFIFKRPET